LSGVDAAALESLPQDLLRHHGLMIDDVEDLGLPPLLHKYSTGADYTRCAYGATSRLNCCSYSIKPRIDPIDSTFDGLYIYCF
jgi:hypothetical protein